MAYNTPYNTDDFFELTPTTTAAPVAPEDQRYVIQNEEDYATAENVAQEYEDEMNAFEPVPQTFGADYTSFVPGGTAPTPGSMKAVKKVIIPQGGARYVDKEKTAPLLDRNYAYLQKLTDLDPAYDYDLANTIFTGLNKFPVIDGKPVTADNLEELMKNPTTKAKIMKVVGDYQKLPEFTEDWDLNWEVQLNHVNKQVLTETVKDARSIMNGDLKYVAEQLDAQEAIHPTENPGWISRKASALWRRATSDEVDPKTGKGYIVQQRLKHYPGKHTALFKANGELMTKSEFRLDYVNKALQEEIDALNGAVSMYQQFAKGESIPVRTNPNSESYIDANGVRRVTFNYNKMKELQSQRDEEEYKARQWWDKNRSRIIQMGSSYITPSGGQGLPKGPGLTKEQLDKVNAWVGSGNTNQDVSDYHQGSISGPSGAEALNNIANFQKKKEYLLALQKKGVTLKNYQSVLNSVNTTIGSKTGIYNLDDADGIYNDKLLNIRTNYNNPKVVGPSFIRPLFVPGKNPFNTPKGNRGEMTQVVPQTMDYNLNGKKFLDDNGVMRPEAIEFSNIVELGAAEPTSMLNVGGTTGNIPESKDEKAESAVLQTLFKQIGQNLYNKGEKSDAAKPYGKITFYSVAAGKADMYAYNIKFDSDYLKKFVGTQDDKGVLYDIKKDDEKWTNLINNGITIYVPQSKAEEYTENEETGKIDMKSIFGFHAMKARQISPREARYQRTGKYNITIPKSGSRVITRNKDNSITISGYMEHLNAKTRQYEKQNIKPVTIKGSEFFDIDNLIDRYVAEMRYTYNRNHAIYSKLLEADKASD
jgi:hypothetical protein